MYLKVPVRRTVFVRPNMVHVHVDSIVYIYVQMILMIHNTIAKLAAGLHLSALGHGKG